MSDDMFDDDIQDDEKSGLTKAADKTEKIGELFGSISEAIKAVKELIDTFKSDKK